MGLGISQSGVSFLILDMLGYSSNIDNTLMITFRQKLGFGSGFFGMPRYNSCHLIANRKPHKDKGPIKQCSSSTVAH